MQERRKQRRESPALKSWLEENGTRARIAKEKRRHESDEEEENEEKEMGNTMPAVSFANLVFRRKSKTVE